MAGQSRAAEDATAETVIRTFLFSDIVRSTDLLAAIGDAAWSSLLQWHDRTLRAQFAAARPAEAS